jgi:hypothetical protein
MWTDHKTSELRIMSQQLGEVLADGIEAPLALRICVLFIFVPGLMGWRWVGGGGDTKPEIRS